MYKYLFEYLLSIFGDLNPELELLDWVVILCLNSYGTAKYRYVFKSSLDDSDVQPE